MKPIRLQFDAMLDALHRAIRPIDPPEWAQSFEDAYVDRERRRHEQAGRLLGVELMPLAEARAAGWSDLPPEHLMCEAGLTARLPDGALAHHNTYGILHKGKRSEVGPLREHLEGLLRGSIPIERPDGLEPLPSPIRAALVAMGISPDAVETLGFICGEISMTIGLGRLKATLRTKGERKRTDLRSMMSIRAPAQGWKRRDVNAAMHPLDARQRFWAGARLNLTRDPTISIEQPMRVVVGGSVLPDQLVAGMSGRRASDVVDHAAFTDYSITNPRPRVGGFAFDLEPITRETLHG